MPINRTAISVVVPTLLAMLIALLALSRSATAQDQTTTAPAPATTTAPAPATTPVKATVPGPANKTVVAPAPRQLKGERDEQNLNGPFTTSHSMRVIRYGRSSRAHY